MTLEEFNENYAVYSIFDDDVKCLFIKDKYLIYEETEYVYSLEELRHLNDKLLEKTLRYHNKRIYDMVRFKDIDKEYYYACVVLIDDLEKILRERGIVASIR